MKLKIKREPEKKIRIVRQAPPQQLDGFWHVHAHSQYSVKDAISPVERMVETAVKHNQKALALTDHGSMGGVVQLYQECKKHSIAPFPGVEAYLVEDKTDKELATKRYHVGLVAFTTEGYEALCRINSGANKRENFHHKPLIDMRDLAEFAELGWTDGIALTTGCYFGRTIQALVTHGVPTMRKTLAQYASYFPHTYVEIQNHHIDHGDGWNDWRVCDVMLDEAVALGLPVVVTQDAHYCDHEQQELHDHFKRLIAFGPDPDDALFPGDGFHLCDEAWIKAHHGKHQWEYGMEGLADLYAKHSLVIPELEKYHYNIPTTVANPLREVTEACATALVDKGLDKPQYLDRLQEEMGVIEASEMAGYLWLTKEICDWMYDHEIFYLARGSASGSLVCWLLGITQVDPIKEGLLFERFLSKDRTKPPDIDLDVEPVRRDEVLEWLSSRFNVCHIGTYGTFGVDFSEGRGSLIVSYVSKLRKQGNVEEADRIKGLSDLPEADRAALMALSDQQVRKSYGTHAGGLVITSTADEFDRLVPTMLVASSGTTVTQYEMDDIESLGLVKLDLLGNRNLSTLRRCVELLGHDVKEGFDWIPLDDTETFKMLRQENTRGIFQMEGWTASKGCREMKVRSRRDIVHNLAVYRPGVMNSGGKDAYIRRKFGKEEVTYLHPMLERHFKDTYGIPIFQEQTVRLLRELGFGPEDLTKFLKAVKASNKKVEGATKVIEGYRETFIELARRAEFSDEAIAWTWNTIEGFAEYGFNKAHAVSYGYTSVRLAYLKANHPLEFAAALLETAHDDKRIDEYIKMVRSELKIHILRADVNVSGVTWTLDREMQAIRKGLMSIKGVGEKAAEAIIELRKDGPFSSVADLVERALEANMARHVTGAKSWAKDGYKGVLGKLYDAGALDSIRGEGE